MTNILQQLNAEMGDVVSRVQRSLVQVRSGEHSGGAGTIWHPDGLIITNAHVVRNSILQVTLTDGRTFPTRLLARDDAHDVAALMVEGKDLPTIELGDSLNLQPGQWALSLGHPWGVKGAATAGVIIGSGNDLEGLPAPGRDWIAVSLPLRPGNSGGPLVDTRGRLIGMNTIMSGPRVGMAVPVHVIKAFLRQRLGSRQPAMAA